MSTDLANFATKTDLEDLRLEMLQRELSIWKWMVAGAMFVQAFLIAIVASLST